GWCAPLLGPPDGTGRGGSGAVAGSRRVIPTGSFIFLKGGNLAGELAPLAEVAGGASVTVRSLDVEGSGDLLTEKKVIIISK
ncbi:MAG TPA: hypothetical protein VJO14_08325, partial [Bacteroidota bacterium]|nr:hypothetical protein [Bacteroidota bacterium]